MLIWEIGKEAKTMPMILFKYCFSILSINKIKYTLQDLSNWVSGWVDWNMALNEQGGPTYINNFVDAPIIVNALVDEFYKQPMYYVLGHFTKFLPKGSQRVMITEKPTLLESVAFSRPDNKTVVIILNR